MKFRFEYERFFSGKKIKFKAIVHASCKEEALIVAKSTIKAQDRDANIQTIKILNKIN
jgi:hypothetical protein